MSSVVAGWFVDKSLVFSNLYSSSLMWPSLTWDSRLAYVLSPCCHTLMVNSSYLNICQRGMDAIEPSRCFASCRVTVSNGWLPLTGGSCRKSAKQTTLIPPNGSLLAIISVNRRCMWRRVKEETMLHNSCVAQKFGTLLTADANHTRCLVARHVIYITKTQVYHRHYSDHCKVYSITISAISSTKRQPVLSFHVSTRCHCRRVYVHITWTNCRSNWARSGRSSFVAIFPVHVLMIHIL